jgi:hypothetical protein
MGMTSTDVPNFGSGWELSGAHPYSTDAGQMVHCPESLPSSHSAIPSQPSITNTSQQKQATNSHTIQQSAFGNMVGPINTDEAWMLIGVNVNGINPFGVNEKLGGTAIKLRHIQAGSSSLIETNVEWQRYEYREKGGIDFQIRIRCRESRVPDFI